MHHDLYDDGLVHGHAWAAGPPPAIGTLLRNALDEVRAPEPDIAAAMASKQDDWHDDGLVHGHGWARG